MSGEEWTSLSLREKHVRRFQRVCDELAAAKASGDWYAICECYAEMAATEIHAKSASLRQKATHLIDHADLDRWYAEWANADSWTQSFYDQTAEYAKTRPGSRDRRARILARVRRFAERTDPPDIILREILQFLAAPDEWRSSERVELPPSIHDAHPDASTAFLTAAKAAGILGVTKFEVHRLWFLGRIDFVRIEGRLLFERAAVTEYVEWRKGMVTEDEAAEILGVSVDRIAQWRSVGRRPLPFARGKPILISLSDLEKFKACCADLIRRAQQRRNAHGYADGNDD